MHILGTGDTRNPQEDSERSFEDPAEAEFVKDEKNSRVADEDPIRPKVTSSPELPKHH